MIRAFWQHYRIRRLVIILGIIVLVVLFKLIIDYMNYSLVSSYKFSDTGFYPSCGSYVLGNKPTMEEYLESDYKEYYTPLKINNEKIIIACLNINYVVYPSFWKSYTEKEKVYSLNEALENKMLDYQELEDYYNNESYLVDNNYKINDLIIYESKP